MNLLKTGLLGAAAALTVAATGARAFDTLTLDGGWTTFYYGYASIFDTPPTVFPFSNEVLFAGNAYLVPTEFDFTLTGNGFLKVTDAFFTGDWYDLTLTNVDLGVSQDLGPTPFPTFNPVFQPDFDIAFHDPDFSSASYYLPAGDYSVTGLVLYTPYSSGAGGIELASNIPEPGAWTMMLAGFAGLGGLARRRRHALAAV